MTFRLEKQGDTIVIRECPRRSCAKTPQAAHVFAAPPYDSARADGDGRL